MCGIAGIISKFDETETINKMGLSLKHRGPDSNGNYINREKGIYLSHNRLSIIDISQNGNQPMTSNDLKNVIIFNGEIYNHIDLREKINEDIKNKNIYNFNWKSTSDTETLLESISLFGLEKTLSMLKGMFAFAIYNKNTNTVSLARDICGEKPIYYGFIQDRFVFASELKSIICHPDFKKKINQRALQLYFQYNFIPEPFSIFENIYKLEKSSLLTYSLETKSIIQKKIYSLKQNNTTNLEDPEDQLHNLLKKSVNSQMQSDVPIGTFLSGGIDSSLITAISNELSLEKIDTFNISYDDNEYDESLYAKKISQYLNTNHHDIRFNEKSTKKIIPDLGKIYCEPFADRSQLPMIFLSKYTSNFKKVVLSGDGADELFGGYNRHIASKRILFFNKSLPYFLRSKLSKSDNKYIERIYNIFRILNNKNNFHNKLTNNQIYKFKSVIKSIDIYDFYKNSLINNEHNTLGNLKEIDLNIFSNQNLKNKNDLNKLLDLDYSFYLTNDILHKVDRASMASSLESRAPFLDYEIKRFSDLLPISKKIYKNKGKIILRNVLKKYLPSNLIDRPKMGFDVPLSYWARNDLKEIFLSYLNSSKIFEYVDVNRNKIEHLKKEFILGKNNNFNLVWNYVVLQIWFETYF